MTTQQSLTFEQAMARLTEIVGSLERADVALSDSMKLFEEGLRLVEQCDGHLKQFDQQITTLMKKHETGGEKQ